jgi:short-subunit dehydrogenase
MSAATVARLGHRAFRSGRVVAITGLRNQLPALAVRFVPRAIVRKITKRLNAVANPSSPPG